MNKNKIDYSKIIKHIIREYPHEIDTIEQVLFDARKHGEKRNLISFADIVKSQIWNYTEKVHLLKIFGYNEKKHKIEYKNRNEQIKKENQYIYCIKNNMLDSFKALILTFKDIKYHDDNISKDNALYMISNYIIDYCSEEDKSKYMECLLETLNENELRRLFKHNYIHNNDNTITDRSLFISILNTNDLEIVKKYITYIDDADSFFSYAINTNNLEIVKYFKELTNNHSVSNSIILTAISNNNYEIFNYLINSTTISRNVLLDYSIRIKDVTESTWSNLPEKIMFYGNSNTINGKISEVNGRIKIVNHLYNQIQDKSKIDYNELFKFSLVTYNSKNLKKYIEDSKQNHIPINFDKIFNFYFNTMKSNTNNKEITKCYIDQIIEFISEYDIDGKLYLKSYEIYTKSKEQRTRLSDEMTISLIENMPDNIREKICIMPYISDIKTLKKLLDMGYDINQVDETGKNILFNVISNEFFNDDKLFDYLISKLDVCAKDIYGKTALYYGLKRYSKLKFLTKTNMEKYISKLIEITPNEELYSSDIRFLIANKIKDLNSNELIEYTGLLHNEIFSTLISKKYMYDPDILEAIYTKIESNNNVDYIFENFDYDTSIQTINIKNYLHQIETYVDIRNNKKTFEGYKKLIEELYNKINELDDYYIKTITKKFYPKKYLEFVSRKYNVVYDNLDIYLLKAILVGLSSFSEKMFVYHDNMNVNSTNMLKEILDICPMFDINSFVINEDIGLSYWDYTAMISNIVGYNKEGKPIYGEDHFSADRVWDLENENISFTGGLVQYAILTNNIMMLKMLQSKGAVLNLEIDDENRSWDYVNSYEILEYMEQILGKKKYYDLDDKEKTYLLKLIDRKK